jgi:hypothetical protein
MRTHTASGTPTAYGYDCGYQDVDEWCADPALCAGKGYCPREPNCAD